MIPKNYKWCTDCIVRLHTYNVEGCEYNGEHTPCHYHRGLNNEPIEYNGYDVYEPSEWVLRVVGNRYKSWRGISKCFGYDPRSGFWMEHLESGVLFNISERAIDRTFYRVEGK